MNTRSLIFGIAMFLSGLFAGFGLFGRAPAAAAPTVAAAKTTAPAYAPGDVQAQFLLVPSQAKLWTDGQVDEIKNPPKAIVAAWQPGSTWGSQKGRVVIVRVHSKCLGGIYVLNVWCKSVANDWSAVKSGSYAVRR